MRYLLIIPVLAIFLAPLTTTALTGDAARLDWVIGQPAITANNTALCDSQATARFDWYLGQPSVIYDTTATCTAAVVATGNAGKSIVVNGGASMQIDGGASVVIQ